jgi:heat shock protein HtpX
MGASVEIHARAVEMYEQITKNKRASLELLANVVAIWLLLGLLIGFAITQTAAGGLDLVACFGVLAVVLGLLAYYRGSSLLLRVSDAHEVGHDEAPQLWNVVEELSIAAGVPMPKVFIVDDLSPNAFATGRDPSHAAVVACCIAWIARSSRASWRTNWLTYATMTCATPPWSACWSA